MLEEDHENEAAEWWFSHNDSFYYLQLTQKYSLFLICTVYPDTVWVCVLVVLISGHQGFKAHELEWGCRTDQQKQNSLYDALFPPCILDTQCECWRRVCARLWGTDPYREAGENRVYMDPSWPLKEREASMAEFIRLLLISGDELPFQVHRHEGETDSSSAQDCHQVEKIWLLQKWFLTMVLLWLTAVHTGELLQSNNV